MIRLTTYDDYRVALIKIDEIWGVDSQELDDLIEAVAIYETENPEVLENSLDADDAGQDDWDDFGDENYRIWNI